MEKINRRQLVQRAALAAGAAVAVPALAEAKSAVRNPQAWKPKKGVLYDMLPNRLPAEERFALAKAVGFDGVEVPPVSPSEAETLRAAADKAGIRIHSIIFGGWNAPLTSGDESVIKKGMENVRTALHSAEIMGCDGILLVPGIVDAKTPYADAYKRSQEHIKRLVPDAEKHKVKINVEEVWNNFLLSPVEYSRYIDEIRSTWVQSYFDVGNVVAFAWPQDWIRTVGKRIQKVHLKDYKGGPGLFGSRNGNFVNLREGSIDWKEVRRAFMEVGYEGFMTTELGGGEEAYLRDVSNRVDKIIAGE